MPIESASNIYQDQLTSLFHGIALWNPDPRNHNARVSIGDVGFLVEGAFIRMFNVMLPWNNPSNFFFFFFLTPNFYSARIQQKVQRRSRVLRIALRRVCLGKGPGLVAIGSVRLTDKRANNDWCDNQGD